MTEPALVTVKRNTLFSRRPVQLIVVIAVLVVIGLWVAQPVPTRIDGEGTVRTQLWCLAIDFDSGRSSGVLRWPANVLAENVDGEFAVRDRESGRVLVRPGDRVAVKSLYYPGGGDGSCPGAGNLTVESFDVLTPEATSK